MGCTPLCVRANAATEDQVVCRLLPRWMWSEAGESVLTDKARAHINIVKHAEIAPDCCDSECQGTRRLCELCEL